MIYDTLTNSHLYYGISARLQKALDFLVNSDFSTIPDGRYEIDGNDVFANISHGMTVQNTPNAYSISLLYCLKTTFPAQGQFPYLYATLHR